jgi:hypothetical protein
LASFSLALTLALVGGCGKGSSKPMQDASVGDLSGDGMTNPCELSGGSCTTVGQCGPGQGYLSSLGGLVGCGSSAADAVCCYATCGGNPTEFACCATDSPDSGTFRPNCNASDKSLECPTGTTPCVSTDM